MGEGDSEGNFEEATFESRIMDALEAISVLRQRSPVDRIALLGLRLGAVIAAIAAARSKPDALMLWAPIFDLKAYFHQWLRTNLTHQMLIHKKVTNNREALIEQLMAGGIVSVEGFLMSNALYQQAIQLDLRDEAGGYKGPVLIAAIGKSSGEAQSFGAVYPESQLIEIEAEPFWGESTRYQACLPELFDLSCCWLEENL